MSLGDAAARSFRWRSIRLGTFDRAFKTARIEEGPDDNSLAAVTMADGGIRIKVLDLGTGAWRTLARVAEGVSAEQMQVIGMIYSLHHEVVRSSGKRCGIGRWPHGPSSEARAPAFATHSSLGPPGWTVVMARQRPLGSLALVPRRSNAGRRRATRAGAAHDCCVSFPGFGSPCALAGAAWRCDQIPSAFVYETLCHRAHGLPKRWSSPDLDESRVSRMPLAGASAWLGGWGRGCQVGGWML